jgi:hypothetical protein
MSFMFLMSSIMSGVQWYLLRNAGFLKNGTSSRRHIRLNVHGVVSNAFAASPMKRMVLYSDAGFCFLLSMLISSCNVMNVYLYVTPYTFRAGALAARIRFYPRMASSV